MKSIEYVTLEKLYYKDRLSFEDSYAQIIGNTNTVYKLPVTVDGYPFFVVSSREVIQLIQDIYIANNKLTRMFIKLPKLAIRKQLTTTLIDEIMQSNDIEGVYSTKGELRIAMKHTKSRTDRFSGLARNYLYISQHKDIALKTSQDIRNLYDDIILPEINKEETPDGTIFRKGPVSVIGKNETAIHNGIYPEQNLIDFLDKTLFWIHDENVPHLIRVAAFHYLFGFAHPFYDGNGRMARFISSYMLRESLNYLVSYRLAYTISEHKISYYKAFTETENRHNRGDLTYFVIVFLNMVNDAIKMLVKQLADSNKKMHFYNEIIKNSSLIEDGVEKELLVVMVQNALFGDESISIKELTESLNYSNVSIRKYANLLCEKGFITKSKDGKSWLYSAKLEKLDAI